MKVSDIVKISGLPYSTVKAILERGAEKAGYVNVCKICNALGISADELEQMVADQNYHPRRTLRWRRIYRIRTGRNQEFCSYE